MKSHVYVCFFILAVRLHSATCPAEQVRIIVTLNGIDQNYVLLGDSRCKPLWSNETHAEFVTHVDNCSLVFDYFFFCSGKVCVCLGDNEIFFP